MIRLFQVFASELTHRFPKPEIDPLRIQAGISLRRIRLEFLALMPTMFSHCQHCMDLTRASGLRVHSQQLNEYPRETRETLWRLSGLARKVVKDFPSSVELRVTDLASPLGFLKSLRHRVGAGPVVLIDGRKVFERLPDYNSLRVELLKAGAEQCWIPEKEGKSESSVNRYLRAM